MNKEMKDTTNMLSGGKVIVSPSSQCCITAELVWTDFEKQKPEKNQKVLVWGITETDNDYSVNSAYWIECSYYTKGKVMEFWISNTTGEMVQKVTHWMPLPQPPKK